jgi:hypothetical protein
MMAETRLIVAKYADAWAPVSFAINNTSYANASLAS